MTPGASLNNASLWYVSSPVIFIHTTVKNFVQIKQMLIIPDISYFGYSVGTSLLMDSKLVVLILHSLVYTGVHLLLLICSYHRMSICYYSKLYVEGRKYCIR